MKPRSERKKKGSGNYYRTSDGIFAGMQKRNKNGEGKNYLAPFFSPDFNDTFTHDV
jgi:hypothetical protein